MDFQAPQRQPARPPGVLRTQLHAYPCRIYAAAFRASFGNCIYWPAHPAASPLSASCSSEQRFAHSFLRIPPRDGNPCRSADTSPCRVRRGLATPSECALPGAPKNKSATPKGGRFGLQVDPRLIVRSSATGSDRQASWWSWRRAAYVRSPCSARPSRGWPRGRWRAGSNLPSSLPR